MLMNNLKLFRNFNEIKTNVRANFGISSILREKWDLFTAVCVERKPVITPELNDFEKEFKQLLLDMEYEKSLKSNHEVKHESDLKQLELLKKGKDIDDSEINLKQTAQDLLDTWTDEFTKFKPSDRITDADKKQDLKSLERKLDKHLVLVVNQTVGKDKFYLLPQDTHKDGETLRQTADRVLNQLCGSELQAKIFGNAPCGFYKYKYPKEVVQNNDSVGAKIFIYFARYIKGKIPSEKDVDFQWLDKEELERSLPLKYKNAVSQFLID